MNLTLEKVAFTGMLSALLIYLEQLIIPVAILLVAMTLDYVTGILAAKHRGQKIDSAKSIKGLDKKVAHLLLIVAGVILDCVLFYSINYFGFGVSMMFLAAIVIAVWLIINELISILENLKDSGAPIPSWLLPLVKNLKSKVENITPQSEKER